MQQTFTKVFESKKCSKPYKLLGNNNLINKALKHIN